MKKIVKGFTLVELIIVMAILVILMAGIMNMFKPIRATFVDSTAYENQRTSQNGMVTYITESVRYATDLGMYTNGEVSNVDGAVDAFITEYLKANNITDATDKTRIEEAISKQAEVIIIDNENTYDFGADGNTYKGRILRRKFDGNEITEDAEDVTKTTKCRLALGEAYYGKSNYSIVFTITQDASTKKGNAADGIGVTVSSQALHNLDDTSKVISTNGFILCKNLDAPINGMFDTTKYNSGNATNKNVYIVYINEKIR